MNTSKVKNKDLPAFASVAISGDNGYQQDGLTKREYFAAMAMQGLLANGVIIENAVSLSIKAADELLKQLEQ